MADEVLLEAIFKAKIREIDPTVRYLYVPGARDTEIWLQGFLNIFVNATSVYTRKYESGHLAVFTSLLNAN